MTPLVGATHLQHSRLSRFGWPIGIALILFLSAGANIAVMFIARGDPAFSVEPDYYQKAVAWDATMAQERTNSSLGWRASGSLVLAHPGAAGSLTLSLVDAAGLKIRGATVSVEAMHNARAGQRYRAALTEGVDGAYAGALDAHRAGEWEVRVTAIRGLERFTQSIRLKA